MARSSIKVLTVLLTAVVFASCATMAKETVNLLLDDNINTVNLTSKPKTGSDNKQLAKEAEKLKKEGKCPICRGMGRTPDGQYICETCKGTGNYIETNSKQA